ncbi:hypothetical protein A3K86_17990 [Photobacterium jeanii]|uniref:NadR/Ttd14 AAA domain-containing protein n=1 Tax=Photobacterium jeanii TaxID=858640 RepID=A0A178K2X3_9GAMM|nr:AAA family ATPase [Photobacterium jeanii]OAN11669.1 hypothetical protein A3K86_17990 [Photobacterium jeanii]PST91203.1 ATP-binding protein [Photobacterium jeanii]
MKKRVVFTGGPGSGKTSVLSALAELGYACVPEAGRSVIKQQIDLLGTALPWDDKTAFRDVMLATDIHQFHAGASIEKRFATDAQKSGSVTFQSTVQGESLCFYERGIIDCYGYSLLEELAMSFMLNHACQSHRYHPTVFIFPPWQEIYVNDKERKQDFTTATATYQAMIKAYQAFDYQLVEVPQISVEQRVAFILEELNVEAVHY